MNCIDLISVNPDSGITLAKPCRGFTSDGEYFVKFRESPAGARELVNEYVGYSLASLLNLPIPEPALLRLPNNPILIDFGDAQKTLITSHFAFGSKALPKAISLSVDAPKFLRQCTNKADLLPIILFDALIQNVDRDENGGNALYEIDSKIVYIIDHGNIFGSGDIWDRYSLEEHADREIKFEMSPKGIYHAMFESCDLEAYAAQTLARFKKLTNRSFADLLSGLPQEWGCSSEERGYLNAYLQKRFSAYNKMLESILAVGKSEV
jgi:hypothetical protein